MTEHEPHDGPSAEAAEQPPGLKLGKIGLILAIIPFTAFLGFCCSAFAMVISRQAGVKNTSALIGIVVSLAWVVVALFVNSLFFADR